MTESVWDYPRPPRIEPTSALVEIRLGGEVIASTRLAVRVLETSHPPGYYLPARDFAAGVLRASRGRGTWCEFKGAASYWDLVASDTVAERAGWSYEDPSHGYDAIRGLVSVYPGRVDGCWVAGEQVQPQEGNFYGGWITSDVTGPFKGAAGTLGW